MYSPFEQGLLVNPRLLGGLNALGKKDVRRRNPHFSDAVSLAKAKTLQNTPAFLIQELLDNPLIDSVIIGPRSVDQLYSCLGKNIS